jgi:hypothetical protein
MLRRIRLHRLRGVRKHCYGCVGDTLLKPRRLKAGGLDIQEEHLAFLHGKTPATVREKLIHTLLIHENTHSERQFQAGVWRHQLRYLFSKSFRLEEEKAAYKAQIEQLVRYELRVRVSFFAQAMSGPIYRRMVTTDAARRWVSETVLQAELAFLSQSLNAEEEEADAVDSFYEMLKPAKEASWIKDRIALISCGLLVFVGLLALQLAFMALTGILR